MLKSHVQLGNLQPQANLAFDIARDVYRDFGLRAVMTSCYRPNAMLHTLGRAFDLRIPSRCGTHPTMAGEKLDLAVHEALVNALGGPRPFSEFDVLLERFPETPANDHLHIEWQPLT